MSRSDPLAKLGRRGTLHLHSIGAPTGWSSLAFSAGDPEIFRLGIGPSSTLLAADALGVDLMGTIAPPAGIEALLSHRLRAWILRCGTAPRSVEAWGSSLGALARRALPMIDRTVHESWHGLAPQSARAAVNHAPTQVDSLRARMRQQLGIREGALAVLAGGDTESAIDAAACFEATSRAVLAGAPIVMVCPRGAAKTNQVRELARGVGLADNLVTVENAHLPGPIFHACDVMLLRDPVNLACQPWWGASAWWALAYGLIVIGDGHTPECAGAIEIPASDQRCASRELIALASELDRVRELSRQARESAQEMASYARIPVTSSPLTSVNR